MFKQCVHTSFDLCTYGQDKIISELKTKGFKKYNLAWDTNLEFFIHSKIDFNIQLVDLALALRFGINKKQ